MISRAFSRFSGILLLSDQVVESGPIAIANCTFASGNPAEVEQSHRSKPDRVRSGVPAFHFFHRRSRLFLSRQRCRLWCLPRSSSHASAIWAGVAFFRAERL